MSKPKASQSLIETSVLTRAAFPANRPLPRRKHAAWAMPRQAIDPSHCPVDHAVCGLAPDYLSTAPIASTHFPTER